VNPARSRVLVVEDRASVARIVSEVLGAEYEVATVADAPAALARLALWPVDVVVTDVRLPGGSGFDVLRTVRELGAHAAVVMMTGYPTVSDAVAAIKLGAFEYLAKPVDASEMALVVSRALAQLRSGKAGGGSLHADDPAPDPALSYRQVVEEARTRASHAYLTELLQACRGNVTAAAQRAGMKRESFHRLLNIYGVRAADFRRPAASEDEPGEGGPAEPKPAEDELSDEG
jgi:DNA-binding NtrC family response regulator